MNKSSFEFEFLEVDEPIPFSCRKHHELAPKVITTLKTNGQESTLFFAAYA